MIRFNKFKFIHWDGTVTLDPEFLVVAGHPEYTLEKGNYSWFLNHNGRVVRSFPDKKAAREYLTDLFNKT